MVVISRTHYKVQRGKYKGTVRRRPERWVKWSRGASMEYNAKKRLSRAKRGGKYVYFKYDKKRGWVEI
jgi:hypothetical protein